MHRFIIKRTERTSPDTLLLTLEPKRQKDRLSFQPGQYAALGFKMNGRPSAMRCFSIVSSPLNPSELQFAMRIYGDFTQAVAALPVGNTVFVRGPFGSFVADTARERRLVFLTGGIGVTPFISMVRYATERGAKTPINLLYSVQSQENIPFYNELLDLEERNPNLSVYFFVSNGVVDKMPTRHVIKGRISEGHLQQLAAGRFNQYSYFICGPGKFMSAMKHMLLDNRVSHDRIVTEEFTPTSGAVAAIATSRHSAPFWTYGLTSVSMALGILFIMALDLVTNVPKTVSAESAHVATTQIILPSDTSIPSTTATTPTTTDTGSTNSSNIPTTTTSSSSSYNSAPTQATTPTYTYTQPSYQPPVSSVS